MALKIKGSPINVVPFIDVLLVLFVIMIVAARFDPITPQKVKSEIPKSDLAEQHKSKANKADQKMIEQMQKKIEQLEKKLQVAQTHKEDHKKDHDHNGESMTVMFGPLGLIKIGNTEISEQSLKDIIRIVQPGLIWDTHKGGEDTESRLEAYIHTQGYSRNDGDRQ